jgi:cation diffusion facilitator family transporter
VSERTGGAEKKRVALLSVMAAVLLTGTKLVIGIMTGSLGILAEAAHSGLDLVAAVITYGAVRVSDRPPDATHLYGHGKVENLSALAETLLLLVTCAWIIYEAVNRLFFKQVHIDANVWAFAVMAMSIIVDVNRSRVLSRVAKEHNSQALEADALHFSTDIWSSAVVIVGLAVVRLNKWLGGPAALGQADAVAALAVALIVIYVSVQLGKRSIDVLLDTAPRGLAQRIEQRVEDLEGVQQCAQVRVRRSGAENFVDLVLAINGDATFDKAHEITARVEGAVRELVSEADVVVHYEPTEASADIVSLVARAARGMGAEAHDTWVRETNGRYYVELDLEVDRGSSLDAAHDLANRLEKEVKEGVAEVAEVVVHLEPAGDAERASTLVGRQNRSRLEATVVASVDELVGQGRCHHVTIWEEEQGLAASLHCALDPGHSVADAHELSERLERYLRERIPELQRVVVHMEPAPV